MPTGTGHLAHTLLAYRHSDRGAVIFADDDFIPPLGAAIDSDACVAACLFGLSLRPGEIDDEFFDGYSPPQRAWVESGRADDLSALAWQLECELRSDC